MKEILEILKYSIPALVVLFVIYFLFKENLKNKKINSEDNAKSKNHDLITPLRLQAYERFVLYLERISPENLILRVNKPELSSSELHNELLQAIRIEFEHNLSQQIYISNRAWELVKNAKADIIHLININAEKIKPDSQAIKLGTAILEDFMKKEKDITGIAINYLKSELNSIL